MSDNFKILVNEYDEFYQEVYGIESAYDSHSLNAKHIEKMVEYIPSKKSRILEYGCANGFNLRFLQREGFINLTGIDGYIENNSTKDIKYAKINFAKEEFSGTYDFIFCRGVLQQGAHTQQNELIKNSDSDIQKIITVFKKLLDKNGIIWFNEGPVRDWIKLFGSKNFIVTNISTNPDVYIAIQNHSKVLLAKYARKEK